MHFRHQVQSSVLIGVVAALAACGGSPRKGDGGNGDSAAGGAGSATSSGGATGTSAGGGVGGSGGATGGAGGVTGNGGSSGAGGLTVDPVRCPPAQEDSDGKVAHESYLRAHSELTHSVTVKLRDMRWDPPACAGDKSETARCAERDQALSTRQALNAQQVSCVMEAFGPQGAVKIGSAIWYEPVRIRSDGLPIPIGTSFSVLALWSQIEAVARHPYVERIEPAPGEAAKVGVSPPEIPDECPVASDPPAPKTVEAVEIQGQGRKPVVIELRRDLLPALRPCTGATSCDDYYASGWELTVAGRRMLTCVRSWIDANLQGFAPDVSFAKAEGILDGPLLPPFGDTVHATLAFGLGLTWEEVTQAAKHPHVQRVWTSADLEVNTQPTGCSPNLLAPVSPRECPTTTESTAGKFTEAAQATWESSPSPNQVLIAVRRGTTLCPLPACPGLTADCPEQELYDDRLLEETTASQACVRALVASIGGAASSEVFVLGDAFSATLTWAQIQTVAAHPHVAQIAAGSGDSPPP